MFIQLEKDDCEIIAERIFNNSHDKGTVYIEFGEDEISIKYEKDVIYSGFCNPDGTRDALNCDLDIISVEHAYFDIEYDENDIVEAFYDVVHRI